MDTLTDSKQGAGKRNRCHEGHRPDSNDNAAVLFEAQPSARRDLPRRGLLIADGIAVLVSGGNSRSVQTALKTTGDVGATIHGGKAFAPGSRF